jgi:hypothetical protein
MWTTFSDKIPAMITSYELQKYLSASLEDVLRKLYPAPLFKWLYEVTMRHLVETYPAAFPRPALERQAQADRTPHKPYLVELLLAILQNGTIGREFFGRLPPATRAALEVLTWEKYLNLAALEKAVGQPIVEVNPDTKRIVYEPFLLPAEHGFLFLLQNRKDPWDYFNRSGKPKKEDYLLLLPGAVRRAFKAFIPPPAGFALLPLDSPAEAIPNRYSCVDQIIFDLRLIAEYIAQGHLEYTKAKRLTVPSLKTLRQMTRGLEFFDETGDVDLARLRTGLVVGGLASAGAKERENLLATAASAESVGALCRKVLNSGAFLHEELLSHLANRQNHWCQHNAQAVKGLAAFFGKLPAGKWVSWENLRTYHTLREIVPTIFESDSCRMHTNVTQHGSLYSSPVWVDDSNRFELISEPLLKGYAFLLAALGMAEIAYGLPHHPIYRCARKEYLSPFDGLRFVRLTPLGEFVFNLRSTCEIADAPQDKVTVHLDEVRLLAVCRNADKLTELALGQFMEPLAPGRYRMTPKSLLVGCKSREDIQKRILLFRRVVTATPPANWEGFFAQILARVAPLNPEPDYVVLKLSADEEIRRLIATDPVLQEIVLKVEGMRIAVRRDDLKKLAKRLEQFGYLSPVPRLT